MNKVIRRVTTNQGSDEVQRITRNELGLIVCPNDFPHGPHSNAVWSDWQDAEVWTCSGTN